MSKTVPEPLTTTIPTEVPATLVLHPSYGSDRLATDDDLRRMGYRHHQAMYLRVRDLFAAMDVTVDMRELDERWNLLRYFIEYVTTYDHDMGPDDLARFAKMINSADMPDEDNGK